jgi:predicted NBD/HSP70 family sugar kinase
MEDVKRRNRTAILGIIAQNGSISRKQIADITGLTPASVTLLCNEMIAEKMLIETGTISMTKGAGRKQVLLELNADYCSILSINIESENTFLVLTDLKSTLLEKKIIKTDRSIPAEEFLKNTAKHCKKILEDHPTEAKKLAGVSVCVPGVVNKKEGTSVRAFGVWKQPVAVCSILKEQMNVPVIIENNVNSLAFAQMFYEGGKNKNNFFLIKWGPGVGSAIVINQQVYEGKSEKTAELGHVIIDKNGTACSCGKKGCLETYVSYQALSKILPFEMEDLGNAYAHADTAVKKEVDEALDIFARSIVNVVTLLAPDQIVLCGKMFHGENIRKKLMQLCQEYDPTFAEVKVVYTEFENREEYIGPIACYIQNKLFH